MERNPPSSGERQKVFEATSIMPEIGNDSLRLCAGISLLLPTVSQGYGRGVREALSSAI